MKLRINILVVILALVTLSGIHAGGQPDLASTRDDGYQVLAVGDKGFELAWKTDVEQVDFELKAPSKGWIALGLNPSFFMEGADFIIAYVDEEGVKIRDDYGASAFSHKSDESLGGSSDVMNPSGSEVDGSTIVRFTLSRNSPDSFDSPIPVGKEAVVLLAFSDKDDFTTIHSWKAKVKITF